MPKLKDRQGVSARVLGCLEPYISPYVSCTNNFMQYDMKMIIYELCNDIKQKEMHSEFTEIKVSKNLIFCKHVLNMTISAAITHNSSKFETWIHEI